MSHPGEDPRRIAMLSVHTSPLDQPGVGDAGGLNVYVVELSKRLAERGSEVEIFTRATSSANSGQRDAATELAPGVLVRHVVAGPLAGLSKEDLPGQLCAFAAGVMSEEAARAPGWYDLVHSHYWLSGQVGWLTTDRWNVPLVHSMHTMAKVKNQWLAGDDVAEPRGREIGEEQVVAAADRLVASTEGEAAELVELYDADPRLVEVVPPGVDLEVFAPASPSQRAGERASLGIRPEDTVLLFAGRIQPLKGPDVLVRAAAEMLCRDPTLRGRLVVVVLGGPSGTGVGWAERLHALAHDLGLLGVPGVDDVVRFEPPVAPDELARWYRCADLVAVPSHSESFGLVAVEAQACGTPVVAAGVGGLVTAVRDGFSGELVDGHDPQDWAAHLSGLIASPERLERLRQGARSHAEGFGWDLCAERMLEVYRQARAEKLARLRARAAGMAPQPVPVGAVEGAS